MHCSCTFSFTYCEILVKLLTFRIPDHVIFEWNEFEFDHFRPVFVGQNYSPTFYWCNNQVVRAKDAKYQLQLGRIYFLIQEFNNFRSTLMLQWTNHEHCVKTYVWKSSFQRSLKFPCTTLLKHFYQKFSKALAKYPTTQMHTSTSNATPRYRFIQ